MNSLFAMFRILLVTSVLAFAKTEFNYTHEAMTAYDKHLNQYLLFQNHYDESVEPLHKMCQYLQDNIERLHKKYLMKLGVYKIVNNVKSENPYLEGNDTQLIDWLGDCCTELNRTVVLFFTHLHECANKTAEKFCRRYDREILTINNSAFREIYSDPYDNFINCLDLNRTQADSTNFECLNNFIKSSVNVEKEVAPRWISIVNRQKELYKKAKFHLVNGMNKTKKCIAEFYNPKDKIEPDAELMKCYKKKINQMNILHESNHVAL